MTLTDEDKFVVLACDGVWDVMTNQEVVTFVNTRLSRYASLAPSGRKQQMIYLLRPFPCISILSSPRSVPCCQMQTLPRV